MMGYIDKNLIPGEQILFRTKKHIIIFLVPTILAILSIYAYRYMHGNMILNKVEWAPTLIVAIYWLATGLNYQFSEFAITNKRVMMREGFFSRHATEMRIKAISQVNVNQNLLGQVLNYGTVTINAFGAFDTYTLIAAPFRFQQVVNEQVDRVS
jgi:uncharacterized membrane protein YdbT with pleckstrin-like domain